MPPAHRALAWLLALVCAACQAATAPAQGPQGAGTPPPFTVGIDGVYLTQSVQDYAGTVPLVQGRAGLLRVFLRASRPGFASPGVRLHLVDTASGDPVQSYTALSPLTEVPTFIVEGATGGSWNVSVPGADVQPGRHLVVDMDPVPGVPAGELRQSFRYPAQGSLDVRPARRLLVTLVPVIQSGLSPDVTGTRTADSWIDRARWIHPLGGVDVGVAAPFTSDRVLEADGTGWADLVADLDLKRVAEGSARTYLGVVKTSYRAGTVGRADLGGLSAVAWDEAASYQRVAAHELGHTFGLKHAPCGIVDPGTFDPAWPTAPAYASAHIGVFGWDPASGVLKDPAAIWDHMSYCGDVHTTWTSDYNYRAVMTFLAGQAAPAAAAPGRAAALEAAPAPRPCLLVSGRVRAGRVELDPAYLLDTLPSAPAGGVYALDLLGGDGAILATFPFTPTVDAAEEEQAGPEEAHFALALPLAPGSGEGLRGLAVRRRGVEVARRQVASAAGAEHLVPGLEVGAEPGHTRLRWDATRHPEVMVRDPGTGEVLGFARGGSALLRTEARELEVVMSDGVRSAPPVRLRAR